MQKRFKKGKDVRRAARAQKQLQRSLPLVPGLTAGKIVTL